MAAITLPSDPVSNNFKDIGSIVSKLLPYVYVVAGLMMLFMLISGGIDLMAAAGNPGKTKSGYGKITAGIVGFVIIFISYFVAQIVQKVLGIKFL